MKNLFVRLGGLMLLIMLAVSSKAQTNTTPTIEGGIQSIQQAIANGSSNIWWTTYGMHAPALKEKWGGGIGAFWPVNTYLLAGTRLDYVNGGFWMPSGNVTVQLPITVWKLRVCPLAYAGVGIPVSGATIGNFKVPGSVHDNNGDPTAITGFGLAVRLFEHNKLTMDAVYDRETWSGFPGWQDRFGVAFKYSL